MKGLRSHVNMGHDRLTERAKDVELERLRLHVNVLQHRLTWAKNATNETWLALRRLHDVLVLK